jgi:hypothetical protein
VSAPACARADKPSAEVTAQTAGEPTGADPCSSGLLQRHRRTRRCHPRSCGLPPATPANPPVPPPQQRPAPTTSANSPVPPSQQRPVSTTPANPPVPPPAAAACPHDTDESAGAALAAAACFHDAGEPAGTAPRSSGLPQQHRRTRRCRPCSGALLPHSRRPTSL